MRREILIKIHIDVYKSRYDIGVSIVSYLGFIFILRGFLQIWQENFAGLYFEIVDRLQLRSHEKISLQFDHL
jgi:hypothetical protein